MEEKKFLPFSELKRLLEGFLSEDAPHLRKKSFLCYQSMVRRFLSWKAEHPEEKTAVYLRNLLITGLSPRTVQSNLSTLKNYLKKAQNEYPEFLIYDLGDFKKLRYSSKSPDYFSDAQIARLKQAIQYSSQYLLWVACELMYYCYIRPEELRHLRVGDLNFTAKKILIRAAHAKNKRNQYVSMPPALEKTLRHYAPLSPDWYLFSVPRTLMPGSSLLGRDRLSRAFRFFLDTTGIYKEGKYSFYCWKHTGVVKAVKAGANIKDVQIQLRHHSLDMVNEYLKNLGVFDLEDFERKIPVI